MYGGFEISPGWRFIVDRLCANIVQQIKWKKIEAIQVEQVKQKLGGLRFYINRGDPAIGGLIAMAEEWAENTCEVCGEKGKERGGNWIRVLCEKHYTDKVPKNNEAQMQKVRYSTNWMGIANINWYKERGLTRKKTVTLTEKSLTVKFGKGKPGDTLEIDEVIQHYSCGRLDFWNPFDDSHYPDELGVPPMKAEDWLRFGDWLHKTSFECIDRPLNLEEIVTEYEKTNPKIQWAKE